MGNDVKEYESEYKKLFDNLDDFEIDDDEDEYFSHRLKGKLAYDSQNISTKLIRKYKDDKKADFLNFRRLL